MIKSITLKESENDSSCPHAYWAGSGVFHLLRTKGITRSTVDVDVSTEPFGNSSAHELVLTDARTGGGQADCLYEDVQSGKSIFLCHAGLQTVFGGFPKRIYWRRTGERTAPFGSWTQPTSTTAEQMKIMQAQEDGMVIEQMRCWTPDAKWERKSAAHTWKFDRYFYRALNPGPRTNLADLPAVCWIRLVDGGNWYLVDMHAPGGTGIKANSVIYTVKDLADKKAVWSADRKKTNIFIA